MVLQPLTENLLHYKEQPLVQVMGVCHADLPVSEGTPVASSTPLQNVRLSDIKFGTYCFHEPYC